MRPNADRTAATIALTEASSPVSAAIALMARPVCCAIFRAAAASSAALSARDNGDFGAFAGELQRDRLADAAAAAGDDGDLAGQIEIHVRSSILGVRPNTRSKMKSTCFI